MARSLGLAVAPGSIIWHAMRLGGVMRYLEEAATNVSRDPPKEGVAGQCHLLWSLRVSVLMVQGLA